MEKPATPFAYRVKSSLGTDRISIVSTPEVAPHLHVATPPDFPKGIAGVWSPETLMLAAVAGCFINTFLALSDKFDFEPLALDCEATGTVERVEGKYVFTSITLYPTLTLSDIQDDAQALKILEKAHRYCLISNSLQCEVDMRESLLFPTAV